jgi:hypothetical protein
VLPAGSWAAIVTAEVDGEQVAVLVSTAATMTAEQANMLDELLGSIARL